MPKLERIYKKLMYNNYRDHVVNQLNKCKVKYNVIDKNKDNRPYVRAVLFKDELGYVLTISMSNYMLEVQHLRKLFNRNLYLVDPKVAIFLDFYNENLNTYIPFSSLLTVPNLIDKAWMEKEAASNNGMLLIPVMSKDNTLEYLEITLNDFHILQKDSWFSDITINMSPYTKIGPVEDKEFVITEIKKKISKILELPLLPDTASELLKIRSNINATTSDLAAIVSRSSSLALQLLTWARSPFYGFEGEINSLEDAIADVLGFDLVLNISLGLAIANLMIIPKNGILGLKKFWQDAVYHAGLNEKIVAKASAQYHKYKGMSYLCGLLHNIGILLLGDLFNSELKIITDYYTASPCIDLCAIERYIIGLSHADLGYFLLSEWNGPEEIQVSVREYFNKDYTGEHAFFVRCNRVSAGIIAACGEGFNNNLEISQSDLIELGLQETDLKILIDEFKNMQSELDEVASLLCR